MAQEVQNVMKEIRLEKVVLNMGLGKSGDAVEIAKKALGQISNKKLMIEIQNWESDWDNSEVERERKLKIKNSKCKSSFNLIMMIQVKTVYKKVKDIKSVFEKFPHLLPETVRFYIKAEGLI